MVLGSWSIDEIGSQKRAAFTDINQTVISGLRNGSSALRVETHCKLIDIVAVGQVVQMPLELIGTIADSDGNYEQRIERGASVVH
ncbi:MAG: hypothetical protein PV358_03475 [Acidimicrobiales bacterium]|nr:hypothetical protein [Acidimicrobiales bacterium]